jgi:hypothetical protein
MAAERTMLKSSFRNDLNESGDVRSLFAWHFALAIVLQGG